MFDNKRFCHFHTTRLLIDYIILQCPPGWYHMLEEVILIRECLIELLENEGQQLIKPEKTDLDKL
jgi:hypothetical protein